MAARPTFASQSIRPRFWLSQPNTFMASREAPPILEENGKAIFFRRPGAFLGNYRAVWWCCTFHLYLTRSARSVTPAA